MRSRGTGSIVKLIVYRLDGRNVSKDTPGAARVESPNWYILYRGRDGRQRREGTQTDSKMKAEAMLIKRMGEIAVGQTPEQDLKSLRYETIRELYLRDNPEQKDYYGLQFIDAFFKNWKISRITTDAIRDFIEHRRKQGIADATIRRNLNPMRAMFYAAEAEGKIGLNDIPHFPMKSLGHGETRRGFLEPPKFRLLLKALPKNLRPLITFVYYTGCRIGAARQITWGMVNEDCSEILLPGEITKTGQGLILPLTGVLTEVAAVLKSRPRTGRVFDTTNLRVEWNKACVVAKLGTMAGRLRTGLTIHDLRRSAVRNLIRAGVSRTVAMTISGHKTEHVFNRYNITDTSDVRTALQDVGKYAKRKA